MPTGETLAQIQEKFPFPWKLVTLPGVKHGMAEVAHIAANGLQVPMFTALRVVEIVSTRIAQGTSPAPQPEPETSSHTN